MVVVDEFEVDVPFLAPALVLVLVPFLHVLRCPWTRPVSANKVVVLGLGERACSRQDIHVLGLSSLGEWAVSCNMHQDQVHQEVSWTDR